MTLSTKLVISNGAMALLTVGLGTLSLISIERLGNLVEPALNRHFKTLESVGVLTTDLEKLRTAQLGVIMYTQANSLTLVEASKNLFRETRQHIREALQELDPQLEEENTKAASRTISSLLAQDSDAFVEIVNLSVGGNASAAIDVGKSAEQRNDEMQKRAGEIAAVARKSLAAASERAARDRKQFWWLAVVCIVVGLIEAALPLVAVARAR